MKSSALAHSCSFSFAAVVKPGGLELVPVVKGKSASQVFPGTSGAEEGGEVTWVEG